MRFNIWDKICRICRIYKYFYLAFLLCQSAGAAVTKYHSLCSLNNRHLFSRSFRGQKSKTQVSAGWVSPEAALWSADGWLLTGSSHGLSPVWWPSVCVQIFSSYGHQSDWTAAHPHGEGNGNPLQYSLVWRIPWMEEPGGLQPTGSQRDRHD